jgi:hypothetical protein
MALLTTSINMNGIPDALRQMVEDDLPFTIARFLTMQAQTGQEAARAGERQVFKLRNDWTTQNTKIAAATKKNLMSEVFTDTENRKSGAPDYLPRQDDGGDKMPIAGGRYLAIPTRYLRKIAPGVIPAALRPRNLLPPGAKIGQDYSGRFGRVGKASTPYPRTKLQHQTLAASYYIAFIQRTKEGTLCIFVRHGGIASKGASHDAEPWYTLISHAHIKARFPMEKLVQEAIEKTEEQNFSRAAAEVLINNALKSGLSVKF